MCVFQSGSYTITLSFEDEQVGLKSNLIENIGNVNMPVDTIVMSAININSLQSYSVLVEVEVGEQKGAQTVGCISGKSEINIDYTFGTINIAVQMFCIFT